MDHYKTLGVEREATADDIKASYRQLCLKYHPDRNKDSDAVERFREVQEACDCLSDAEKRRRYDMETAGGPFAGMHDIFGAPMWRNGNYPIRGENIVVEHSVDLEEIFEDKLHAIAIARDDECPDCQGKKVKAGASETVCVGCKGSGYAERTYSRGGVHVRERRPCVACSGQGKSIAPEHRCDKCGGQGTIKQPYQIQLTVPAGIEGQRTFLARQFGNSGRNGGPRGDVFIHVMVRPHPKFERVDMHLSTRVPISVVKACLGGPIEVETLQGKKLTVEIPQGCQNAQDVRVEGEGLPILGKSGRGSLFVIFDVQIPKELSDEQKRLYEQLAALERKLQ